MKKIALFYNEEKPKAKKAIPQLQTWLNNKGIKSMVANRINLSGKKFDCAIALGGDGTMLKVARKIAPYKIPLFGVNVGRMGFLAEMDWEHLYAVLTQVIAGTCLKETRCMLEVSIHSKQQVKTGADRLIALNDCVIRCGGNARVIVLDVWVGKEYLAEYHGDGLIISTPTGSTAYSLAASGPIVHPELNIFIITPICPHTLAQRPIIINAKKTIRIKIREHDPGDSVIVSLDGQLNFHVRAQSEIKVKRSAHELHLISNPHENYFSILRKKLAWGKRGESTHA